MRFVYKLKFHTELHAFIKKRHKHVFFFLFGRGNWVLAEFKWCSAKAASQRLSTELLQKTKQNQTNKHTNNPEHKVTIK